MKQIIRVLFMPSMQVACGSPHSASTHNVTFDRAVSDREWSSKDVNPDLPSNTTGHAFLVIEFRTTANQQFEPGLKLSPKYLSKHIHPHLGVCVSGSIPSRFGHRGLGNAIEASKPGDAL